MFKPGERAKVKATGDIVTIKPTTAKTDECRWPVQTTAGVFDETALAVAHESVLPNAVVNAEPSWVRCEDDGIPRISWDDADKIEKILRQATFDWNGHWKNGESIYYAFKAKIVDDIHFGQNAMSLVDAAAFLAQHESGVFDRWFPFTAYLSGLNVCGHCGDDVSLLETNGQTIRFAGDRCTCEAGLVTEWELNVPSGKLVVANDLRALFPLLGDDFDVNKAVGRHQTAGSGWIRPFCPTGRV